MSTRSNPPNILFIIADQHNARMIGAAGDPIAHTPNIDKIASRGMLFDRAYSVSPICSPSRISIYTGKEPAHHGYYGNANWTLTDDCPEFLPTLLRQNGYQTALVGRSHMVYKWDHEGFEQVSYMNFGDCDRYCINDNPWLKQLIKHGAADHYDIAIPHSVSQDGGFTSSMPLEHCEEMWVAKESVEFLKNRDKDKPFFLHVGYDHPHDPIAPPVEFDAMFDEKKVILPKNYTDTFKGKPQRLFKARHNPGGYPYTPRDDNHLKWLVAKQYALVALLDHSIGMILSELEKAGELDNTLIVYTSDHGDFAGEHGMVLKNLGIYESVHRSPCIISLPDAPVKDKRTQAMVELIDIYPTILHNAGIEGPVYDGHDLSLILNGKANYCRDHTICDWDNTRAIRAERYRLVYYDSIKEGELYDVECDPGEENNLWEASTYQSVKEKLLQKLHERTVEDKKVYTSFPDDPAAGYVKQWFKQDSPIYAMWRYGIKWSQLQPYMETLSDGSKRLTMPAESLKEIFPCKLPVYKK